MAQELSEKELLKMEVEQLKKEVKNPRVLVSPICPSLPLLSSPPLPGPYRTGTPRRSDRHWGGSRWGRRGRLQREAGVAPWRSWERTPQPGGPACPPWREALGWPCPAPLGGKNSPPHPLPVPLVFLLSNLCPHPAQDPFSWTKQIMDPDRQTRERTTLCFFTDFQDGKGNQGLCGGGSGK